MSTCILAIVGIHHQENRSICREKFLNMNMENGYIVHLHFLHNCCQEASFTLRWLWSMLAACSWRVMMGRHENELKDAVTPASLCKWEWQVCCCQSCRSEDYSWDGGAGGTKGSFLAELTLRQPSLGGWLSVPFSTFWEWLVSVFPFALI